MVPGRRCCRAARGCPTRQGAWRPRCDASSDRPGSTATRRCTAPARDSPRPSSSELRVKGLDEALEHAQPANTELRDLVHGILPAALARGRLGAGVEAVAARLDLPV